MGKSFLFVYILELFIMAAGCVLTFVLDSFVPLFVVCLSVAFMILYLSVTVDDDDLGDR